MSFSRRLFLVTLSTLGACLLFFPSSGWCQMSPAEITNPRLKALEKANLDKLMELNHEISHMKFPFPFVLTRYVGLDPKAQIAADTRGIEFVKFHDRLVLKISGNYNAAFNSDLLTQNERANHVVDAVVAPLLPLLTKYFPGNPAFDAFGFEISYHVRTHNKQFGYEGKEFLALSFSKADVSAYLNAQRQSSKQEIIDRSEVYLDGKEFGLALGQRKAFDVADLDKSDRNPPAQAVVVAARPESKTAEAAPAIPETNLKPNSASPAQAQFASPQPPAREADPAPTAHDSDIRLAGLNLDTLPTFRLPPPVKPATLPAAGALPATPSVTPATLPAAGALPATPSVTPAPTAVDLDELQKKYQPQLDTLTQDGLAHYHFVDYAPASIGLFHNQVYLQVTLRNPALFDRTATSIYKRAAQSFDLFLAPQLKGMLAKIPSDQEISGVDVTVLDEFSRSASSSSEALEFICPVGPLRQFADAEITNQDLINQSVILVNGVRIALNLQQVE